MKWICVPKNQKIGHCRHRKPCQRFVTVALLGAIILAVAPLSYGSGVTIITHGYNPSVASAPLWMDSMRDDIAANFADGEQLYGAITVTGTTNALTATCSPWSYDLSTATNAEVMIVVDWSAVSDHLTKYVTAQSVASAVVARIVATQNDRPALAELPIHLIGHSRGGGMVCEIARQLGEQGIVVDHLTPLDPHSLTTSDTQPLDPPFGPGPVIDTSAAIYQNVTFADVYYQTASNPVGEYLTGAYNRHWATALVGGYHDNGSPTNIYPDHRNILLLYQGTVNSANPLSNDEASMGTTERAAWFNTYETVGTNTGFMYSRLDGAGDRTSTNTPVVGGDEIRAGLNGDAVFGGGGARSNLTWGAAVWPNVAALDVLSNGAALGPGAHQIVIGTTQQLRYVYLDYDSGCTVTLHLDADRNPYNSNDVAVLSTQVFASATGATYTENTVNWNTAGVAGEATGYVCAQVTDGTYTRYFYAASRLHLVASEVPSASVHYVWTNSPASAWPYTNWTTAAHSIQDAVDAASDGDTVLVTNGVYDTGGMVTPGYVLTNRVCITNGITVRSVNGPTNTFIVGGGSQGNTAIRCAYLVTNAVLDGFTLTNGHTRTSGSYYYDESGGGALLDQGGTLSNCVMTGCSAYTLGGGASAYGGGSYENCAFIGNSAENGGGANGSGTNTVNNCLFARNSASWDAGGYYNALTGGTLNNCTIVSNSADNAGGATYFNQSGTLNNCIAFGNSPDNIRGSTRVVRFTCSPDYSGSGNITNDPVFVDAEAGDYRLSDTSPCINAGSNSYAQGATDLDGNLRIIGGVVDMGAYEYLAPGITITNTETSVPWDQDTIVLGGSNNEYVTGTMFYTNATSGASGSIPAQPSWTLPAISLEYGTNLISVSGTNAAGVWAIDSIEIMRLDPPEPPVPVIDITNSDVTVSGYTTVWTIGGTNNSWIVGTMTWTNAATGADGSFPAVSPWSIEDIDLAPGENTITVFGTNVSGVIASDSVVITREKNAGSDSPTHFVWAGNPAPLWPYTNWAMAACSIQDAVDAASDGDTVLVTDGVYDTGAIVTPGYVLTNRVCITNAITVRSVNGPTDTFIVGGGSQGNAAIRCAYLAAGAVLDGFTLTNGHTRTSGSYYYDESGGGALLDQGGTLSNCVMTGCSAYTLGGGASAYGGGSYENCAFIGNSAENGGGANGRGTNTVNNCFFARNSASQDAGGYYNELTGGTLNNCTIISNSAGIAGGATYFNQSGTLNNCIAFGNSPDNIRGSTRVVRFTCSPDYSGSGNITNDPVFVDAEAGDYRLSDTSPCINAGSNSYAQGATDLDGNPRIIGGVVDMGAYEVASVGITYVAPGGSNVWPYRTWANAATTIQAAVNAVSAGGTVWVSNGVYSTGGIVPHGQGFTNRVVITNDIVVRSVNGPANTFIVGASDSGTNGPLAVRCVWISDGLLTGFTITNGHTQITGDWTYYQRGGGVFLDHGGTVSNCVISGNSANITGGGVDFQYGGLVVDSIIEGNTTTLNYGGAGASLHNGALLDRCIVRNNRAAGTGGDGGGLYFYSGGHARNCLVALNAADDAGGGFYVRSTATNALVESCTVVSNAAAQGGGAYQHWGTNINSIIYGNTATSGSNNWQVGSGTVVFDHCDADPLPAGSGCISDDPLFAGNCRLQAASPCIDAGTNQSWMTGSCDLDGRMRIMGSRVDMGCFERIVEDEGMSPQHYVSPSGGDVWPYADWATAAHAIQDAVDTAAGSDTVWVADGLYDAGGAVAAGYALSNRVCVTKCITLQSVNGPEGAFIVGASDSGTNGPAAVRCLYVEAGAVVNGFTLTNGHTFFSGDYEDIDIDGGGAYLADGSISNCVMTGNSAERNGGGLWGGSSSSSLVTHCVFRGNTAANRGGGIYLYAGSFADCLIVGNTSVDWGGGVYIDYGSIYNCTIADNQSDSGGGIGGQQERGTVYSSIIWGNTSTGGDNEISVKAADMKYSCSPSLSYQLGCITNNPQLADAAAGDYHLLATSPCIDAGINLAGVTDDLDGMPRPLDGDANGSATVDMGCYEVLNANADSDGDTMKDGWELDYDLNPTDPSDALADDDDDMFINRDEFIADTDPTNGASFFCVTNMTHDSPFAAYFDSSTGRVYTMQGATNLVEGIWTNVPGAGPRMGAGGSDSMQDTNEPPAGPFYRMEVQLP